MELIRSWGLEDDVLAGGVEVDWLMWESPTLAGAERGTAIEVGLPTRAQAALISPTAPACVPQDHLERVLLDHLRSLGPARVELGTALVGLENGPDGVRVTLRDAAGRDRVVTAGYVVAADGARSTARARAPDPDARLPGCSSRASLRCSARHSGRFSASTATASTRPTDPGAEGVLPARGTRRPLGLRLPARATAGLAGRLPTTQEMTDRIRLAAGDPRSARPDRADRLVHLGRPDRRSLPRGRTSSWSVTPRTA